MIPFSLASLSTPMNALLSTNDVIKASGLRANGRLHIGDLLFDRAFRLHKDELTFRPDLCRRRRRSRASPPARTNWSSTNGR